MLNINNAKYIVNDTNIAIYHINCMVFLMNRM